MVELHREGQQYQTDLRRFAHWSVGTEELPPLPLSRGPVVPLTVLSGQDVDNYFEGAAACALPPPGGHVDRPFGQQFVGAAAAAVYLPVDPHQSWVEECCAWRELHGPDAHPPDGLIFDPRAFL